MLPILAVGTVAVLVWWLMQSGDPHQGHTVSGPALVAVTVPTLTAAAATGREVFNANCAACHGQNAAGVDGAGPPLVHIIYEPSHHGDVSFHMAVQQGVRAHHWPFGNMPPIEGVSQKQVTGVIAYIRELQRANGIN